MDIRREEIKSEREYDEYFNNLLNGEIKNIGGFYVPNSFQLNIEDEISKRGVVEGLEFYKRIYFKRRFSTISSDIWSSLAIYGKCILYDIVGFISNNIGYNTNVVSLTYQSVRAFTNRNISNRDFINAINILENKNIIMKTNKRSVYAVNPLMIYKGSIEKFAITVTNSRFDKSIIVDNKLCIDKIMLYECKDDKEPVLIRNGKYYKKDNNIIDSSKSIKIRTNTKDINDDRTIKWRVEYKD